MPRSARSRAVATATAVVAAMLGPVAVRAVDPVFPADAAWTPLTKSGITVFDAPFDTTVAQRDIVNTSEYAVAVAADATYLFGRIRVDGDPTGFASACFVLEIDTDGDPADGYERAVVLDARDVVVEVWALTTGSTGSVSDVADTLVSSYASATNARVTSDGSNDFFADFAVPLADLGLGSSPMRFVAGTRAIGSPALVAGASEDIAGVGVSVAPSVADAVSDPLACGAAGCSTPTAGADVAVALRGPRSTGTGRALRYRVEVANLGPGAATGVGLIIELPAGIGFSSLSASGWTCTTPTAGSPGLVTCDRLTELAPGSTVKLSLAAITTAGSGDSIVVTATASTSSDDPEATNDAASTTVLVR